MMEYLKVETPLVKEVPLAKHESILGFIGCIVSLLAVTMIWILIISAKWKVLCSERKMEDNDGTDDYSE